MDKEVSIELFKAFLVENNALECFSRNLSERRRTKLTFEEYVQHLFDNSYFLPTDRFITSAFCWSETSEGFLYWYSLNALWFRQINN